MKAHIYTLCCVLVTGHVTAWAQAQVTPPAVAAQDAITESLRREAAKIELRQKLADAQAAQQKGDIYAAARLYTESLALTKRIGTGVETEYAQVLTGVVQTQLILAEQAQRRGEFEQADLHVGVVLKEDPKNEAALAFRAQNARVRASMAGLMPSQDTIARLPEAHADRVRAATHVQNGKVLFEAGKFDEAEAQLTQATKIDPSNTAAYTYINIIREQRHKMENASRESWSKERLLEVDRAWNPPVKRELLASPNPSLGSNSIYTSKGRQSIYAKLDRIRIDSLSYDGLPLSEVVKSLAEEARRRDPERRGINIIVSANADPPSAPPAPIDPATGLPVATGAVAEPIDLGSTTIRIVPPITDITLGQALDAIQRVSDRPIKYSVEDYAIVFSPKALETPPLYTRTFKIDPNTFVQGLAGVVAFDFGVSGDQGGGGGGGGGRGGGGGGGGRGGGGGGGGGGQGQVALGAAYLGTRMAPLLTTGAGGGGQQTGGGAQPLQPPFPQWSNPGIRHLTAETPMRDYIDVVRQFFLAAGVDLAPPKAIFWHDRLGKLMVRATLQDLDIIEQAVQMLNEAPPQIMIDAKFAEVTQDDAKALGFDWFLGNTLIGNQRMGLQGGTAPIVSVPPSTANPTGFFPLGDIDGFFLRPTDTRVTTGLRNTVGSAIGGNESVVPAVGTFTGLLTDPQFRLVIRALEQRRGVDLLSAPRVTTMSGRQAQVKVVRVETIATGLTLDQTTGGGGNP